MTPTLPAGRYSTSKPRRFSRRTSTVIVLTLGALFGLMIAVVAYRSWSNGPISGEDLGFSLDGNSAIVKYSVSRDDPARPAVCILRALSKDGSETGRSEMYIPPSTTGQSTYVGTVHTSQAPVMGNVFGCSYTVPAYLQPR